MFHLALLSVFIADGWVVQEVQMELQDCFHLLPLTFSLGGLSFKTVLAEVLPEKLKNKKKEMFSIVVCFCVF